MPSAYYLAHGPGVRSLRAHKPPCGCQTARLYNADMTRLARHQLLSCPMCSAVYKHPLYSSISVYVSHDLNPRLDRICTNCEFRAALNGWEDACTVETCTPEVSTLAL